MFGVILGSTAEVVHGGKGSDVVAVTGESGAIVNDFAAQRCDVMIVKSGVPYAQVVDFPVEIRVARSINTELQPVDGQCLVA